MKTCLNCKYEPEWRDWTAGKYERCIGRCKWAEFHKLPVLPETYRIQHESITRFRDDSGIKRQCKTWEAKK